MDLAKTIFGIDPEKYQTVENTVEDGVTQEDGIVEIRLQGEEKKSGDCRRLDRGFRASDLFVSGRW